MLSYMTEQTTEHSLRERKTELPSKSPLSIWLYLMPVPSIKKQEKKQLKWEIAPLLLNSVKELSHEECQKESKKPRHTAPRGRARVQDVVLNRIAN